MSNDKQEFSTELLRVYYDRLFPYTPMFDWLSYGNNAAASPNDPFYKEMDKEYFMKREWSFTIEDDIYIRYQCFRGKHHLSQSRMVALYAPSLPL
jgi:DNA primase small subunit